MGLFDFVRRDPAAYTAPSGVPSPDDPHELALYKFDGCPYCQRVLRVLKGLPVEVELRDTMRDATHRRGLLEKTGRTQVPCLFIGEYALFESEDISRWLEAYAVRGGAAS
ncbi:MAG: glutaredoxin family protein [Myxococcota bacterium]